MVPLWLQIGSIIFGILGVIIGTIGGALGFSAYFSERAKHKAQKKNEAEDKAEAKQEADKQKLEELEAKEIMNNLAEQLADILMPKIKLAIAAELQPVKEDLSKVKSGVQVTCRYDLDELTNKADAQGWLSQYDKDRYTQMYISYHGLGENGVMDAAYNRIVSLPNKPPVHKGKKNSKK